VTLPDLGVPEAQDLMGVVGSSGQLSLA